MADTGPLLQPSTCPPTDGSHLLPALELLARALEVAWVELELAPDGEGEIRRLRVGTPTSAGVERTFPGHPDATLRLPEWPHRCEAVVELALLAVDRGLEAARKGREACLLGNALTATSTATLLFGTRGDILYANEAAERLLSRQTEHGLGILDPQRPPEPLFSFVCELTESLAADDGADHTWRGSVTLTDDTVLDYELTRIAAAHCPRPCGVVAHLRPSGALAGHRIHAFAAHHDLSPREQEVLGLLEEGLSVAAMAERLCISRHTVRDHLKHLYRKTDTGSQRELLIQLARTACRPRSR